MLPKRYKGDSLRTGYQGLANTPDRLSGFRITRILRTDYKGLKITPDRLSGIHSDRLNIKVYETLFILTHIITTLTSFKAPLNPLKEGPCKVGLNLMEKIHKTKTAALQQASVVEIWSQINSIYQTMLL